MCTAICLSLPGGLRPLRDRPAARISATKALRNARGTKAGRSMIRGIHHIAVHVGDLDRMIAFYRDAFGFELVGEEFAWADAPVLDRIIDVPGSAARGAMLRAGSCYLEMFQFSAPEPGSTGPLSPADKGYTHFCVDVTEIEQECVRLAALGMSFGDRTPVDMGHVKSIYGRDPEGNYIEIQQTADHCEFRMDQLPAMV
jgi:glyoxylase I family protein